RLERAPVGIATTDFAGIVGGTDLPRNALTSAVARVAHRARITVIAVETCVEERVFTKTEGIARAVRCMAETRWVVTRHAADGDARPGVVARSGERAR